jgi:hypothetical protein
MALLILIIRQENQWGTYPGLVYIQFNKNLS